MTTRWMALLAGCAACGGAETAATAGPARVQLDVTYFAQRLNAPSDPPASSPRVCQSVFANGATWAGVYDSLRVTRLEDLSTPVPLGGGVRAYVAGTVQASAVGGSGAHAAAWRRGAGTGGPQVIGELRDLGAIWIDRVLNEPQPRAHTSHAFAVNDVGQVAGDAYRGGIPRAMLYDYERDVMIDLDEESSADAPVGGVLPGSHPTLEWKTTGLPQFTTPVLTGACREREPSTAYGLGEVVRTVAQVALPAPGEPPSGAPVATVTTDVTRVVGTSGACGTPGSAAVEWTVTVETVACPGPIPPGTSPHRHRVDVAGLGPWELDAPNTRDAVFASIGYAINRDGVVAGRQVSPDNVPAVFTERRNVPTSIAPFPLSTRSFAAFGISDCPPRAPVPPPLTPGVIEPPCGGPGFVVVGGGAPLGEAAIGMLPADAGAPTDGGLPVGDVVLVPTPLPLGAAVGAPTASARGQAITRDGSVVVGQFAGASLVAARWTFAGGRYNGQTLNSIVSNAPTGFREATGVNEVGEMLALTSAAGFVVSPANAHGGPVRAANDASGCDGPRPAAPSHIPRSETPEARIAALRALCGL
jgi:hypothetical protein